MGQFFDWNGKFNAYVAQDYGFRWNTSHVEGTACRYENLDNYQTGIHDYFKYIKFGFGRTTDIVSSLVRRRELDREEGKKLIIKHDGKYGEDIPYYLGKSFEIILKDIGVSLNEYSETVTNFVNRDLFDIHFRYVPIVTPKFIKDLQDA